TGTTPRWAACILEACRFPLPVGRRGANDRRAQKNCLGGQYPPAGRVVARAGSIPVPRDYAAASLPRWRLPQSAWARVARDDPPCRLESTAVPTEIRHATESCSPATSL